VSRLVREELLVRETDPAERRRIRLTLSAEGSGQLDQARSAAVDWLRARVATLEPARQRGLVAALADLRSLVETRQETEEAPVTGEQARAT
jgi:DNA-binding MarR family transcriptional regulator